VQTRSLGRTGHDSSVAILGGAAFWDSSADEAAAPFRAALDAGVNHLDVAPQYGRAEVALGPHVGPVREGLFVGCKTLRKDPAGVRAQLEESLTKLHCDYFDLYQLHAVTDLDELEARSRAVEVILKARDEGLCRFAGITGHNLTAPAAHLEAIRRYDLDTVMFPVNPRLWADLDYRRDAEALLEEATSRNLGVMAIKAGAARPWGERTHTASTWYEPYVTETELDRNIRFVLNVPGVQAFCTPGDLGLLPTVFEAAERATPMTTAEADSAMSETSAEPHIFPMPALN
jgi:aryl-alcohol dehydrogenase-like predicted oxidoreductase